MEHGRNKGVARATPYEVIEINGTELSDILLTVRNYQIFNKRYGIIRYSINGTELSDNIKNIYKRYGISKFCAPINGTELSDILKNY